jgi:hypothetical protein
MTAHGLFRRGSSKYALAVDHPAAAEVVAVALRLPPPKAAIRLVLRASTTAEFACVDEAGFIVGTRSNPDAGSLAALDAALAMIRRDRPNAPSVLRFEIAELGRLLHSAPVLRTRVASAEVLKGVRRVGPLAASG